MQIYWMKRGLFCMLKIIRSIIFSLLMLLLLIGCGTSKTPENDSGVKIGDIPYEKLQLEDTPEDIQATIQYKGREKSTFVLPSGDDYYVIVTRGEQPTGGFTVEITGVEE